MKMLRIGFMCITIIFSFSLKVWAIDYSQHTDEQMKLVWKNKLFLDEADKRDFMAEWNRRFQYEKPDIIQSNYLQGHQSYYPWPMWNFSFSYQNYKHGDGHGFKFGYHPYGYHGYSHHGYRRHKYNHHRYRHHKDRHGHARHKYRYYKHRHHGYGSHGYRQSRHGFYKRRHHGPRHYKY